MEEAEWKPYYDPSDRISCSDPRVKVSAWQTDDKILAVCASTSADYEGEIHIRCDYPTLHNGETGELLSENGACTFSLHGFDYIFLEGKK